ncbi:MAG TPA: type II toxin-antitoxin system VapC family toxin [Candidatus Limnocylindrales bacterium]|nr:type II toxin-antitoxin system VapC family toxin [Candidatus Limnocylindrales bacterium]
MNMKKNSKRDTNVLYLDANIFIYAAANTENSGDKARLLLTKIQRGCEEAITSALTFDEVFWVLRKDNLELAFSVCEAMLNFPHLEILAANREIDISAMKIIKESHLTPRDAIHAATAISGKADFIVSDDAHFDRVKELKRKEP